MVLNYQIIKIISDVKVILGKDLGKYNITVLSILNLFLPVTPRSEWLNQNWCKGHENKGNHHQPKKL